MIVQAMLTGGKQVLLNSNVANHILRAIEEEHADGARYLPQLVHAHELNTYNVSSLKYMIQGGYHLNPCHFQTVVERFGPILIHGYGATETGGIASLTPDQYWRDGTFDDQYIRSCGHALPGVTIRIVDEYGNVLPPGETGEVLVHTRALMPGYWRNPAATAQAIGDGWFHTHDIGLLDENAYLFLMARNETPSGVPTCEALDVDTLLCRHASVADSATFARLTPNGCRTIVAVVEPRPGARLQVDALMAYCRCQLAENDKLLEIHVVDCMPRNTSGKILRRQLREQYLRDDPATSVISGKAG